MGNIAPEASSEAISRSMKSNKRRDTSPELEVRAILREMGHSGYRIDWKKAPGRPDIAYPGRKIAIFVNGCFWHRCPMCNLPVPKTHSEYWIDKFEKNIERDKKNYHDLERNGWKVLVLWECELKDRKSIERKLNALFDRLLANTSIIILKTMAV